MKKTLIIILLVLINTFLSVDAKGPSYDEMLAAAQKGDAEAQVYIGDCYWYGDKVSQNYYKAVSWYRKAAVQGNAEAQYVMGISFRYAIGNEENFSEAAEWFRHAAKQGHSFAQVELGLCYEFGEGVDQDYVQAVRWYKESADQGNSFGQAYLGDLYEHGNGVEQSYTRAVELYQKSAEQENSLGQYCLANCYFAGNGVTQDYSEAAKWFRKSADQGNPDAQYMLALMYLNGDGVKQSNKDSAKWMKKSAEQGHPDAQFYCGDFYYYGNGVNQNYTEAFNWYSQSAKGGSIDALYGLAQCYEQGNGVEQNHKKAIDLFRQAAEAGHAPSQYCLSMHYYTGEFIGKDINECLKWAYASAKQEYVEAQYLLGVLLHDGEEVEKKLEEAFSWMKAAAEQGYDEAQVKLGYMYANGEGTEQNYNAAVEWYQKAADQENPDGYYNLATCYNNGLGVDLDHEKAAANYRASAILGLPDAQYHLGIMLLQGTGTAKNTNEAALWLNASSNQGNNEASSVLYNITNDGYTLSGKLYTFDEKSHYEISEDSKSLQKTNAENTYGTMIINGNISSATDKDGIAAYDIGSGDVEISYRYVNDLLIAPEKEWHLIDDKSKKVDSISLKKDIKKGAIILLTSPDHVKWTTAAEITNAFYETPVQMESFYKSSQIQLSNGCYYRVIVVYELQKNANGSKSTKKQAELYEFYLFNSNKVEEDTTIRKQRINAQKIRVDNTQGYTGEQSITRGDPHYGWDLGSFYVSGFTSSVIDDNGNPIFLKNVGDRITLWFSLDQDIESLPAKDKDSKNVQASIHNDDNYDNYFETDRINFGRGAIITRFTDHNGDKETPVIYADFLGAYATRNADTQVTLFEEGDYEVALDYAIKTEPRKIFGFSVIPEYSHYRIFFRFSVRNGNCMVFPFDNVTGAELTNTSVTENGFYLDLAKSRYLDINVKKDVLTEGANGYIADPRFNRPARDGETYIDEGIYTITAANRYTGQTTQKIIYVGTNDILSNYVSSGMTLDEIINKLSSGTSN